MKKQKNLIILTIVSLMIVMPFISSAQNGIKFEKGLSWQQVKTKAKADNKYIFVDCYATWCGPCKYMTNHIFPLKEVGDYMNGKFVSVAVQMDKTINDPKTVRDWYKDAANLQLQYAVNAFPTYLIFSPDGKPLHRIEGATGSTGEEFINSVSDAFTQEKRHFAINKVDLTVINGHEKDTSFLSNLIDTAFKKDDLNGISVLCDYYFDGIKDPFERHNLRILERGIKTGPNMKIFNFLLTNKNKIKRNHLGDYDLDGLLRNRITQDELIPLLAISGENVDWQHILADMKQKYPDYADQIVARWKPFYYIRTKHDQQAYGKTMIEYVNAYSYQMSGYDINSEAWNIFLICDDPKILREALKWSKSLLDKEALTGNRDWNNTDTYANILYKLGDKENALLWENKCLQIVEDPNTYLQYKDMPSETRTQLKDKHLKAVKATIEKMANNQKTW